MIQNVLNVSIKGWKILLKSHTGTLLTLTAGGSAIFGVIKVRNKIRQEAEKLNKEIDIACAEYKRRMDEILEETIRKTSLEEAED